MKIHRSTPMRRSGGVAHPRRRFLDLRFAWRRLAGLDPASWHPELGNATLLEAAGHQQQRDQKRSTKMTSLTKTLFGVAMGAGVLAFSAMNASAAVVCTGNTCWHATENTTTRQTRV
jgi:hypothetical protein